MTGSNPTGEAPSESPLALPRPADTPTPPDRRFDDGPSASGGELFDPRTPLPGEKRTHWGWFLVGVTLLYCVYMAGAYVGQHSRKPAPLGPFPAAAKSQPPLKVHVAGLVKKPGVYELPFNSRVQDAVQKAGGPLPGANINALNLADWAQDGSKIEVPPFSPTPAPEIAAPTTSPLEIAPLTLSAAPPGTEPALPALPTLPALEKPQKTTFGAATTPGGAESDNAAPEYLKKHPINLNKATQEQLESLPGIGPKIAADILAFRKQVGGFQNVDQLDAVKGIGEKKLAKVKPFVVVK